MAKPADIAYMEESSPPHDSGVSNAGLPPLPGASESVESTSERYAAVQPPIVQIRPYSLADIPAVLRLPGKVRLDVPDTLVLPGSGALDLPAALPIMRRERPTFVATADNQPIGFVRFSPRRPDGRWVVSSIAAATGVFAPEPVWEALLAYGVRTAGLRGVRRLFARVPVGHALLDVMLRGGWTAYARETIFRADRLTRATAGQGPGQGQGGFVVRMQEPADTWAIHQLYAASVPRKVQELEALTSHVWHMEPARTRRSRRRETGWLVEDDGHVAAYARYTRGPSAGMIDLVVPPGEDDLFGAVLDAAMAAIGRGRQPVYCALRGYLADHADHLRARGFTDVGEQELLIRYTTAVVKAPTHDPVLFPVELRPAMPRRVPTFLEGQPMDGTA
jgi:hypothetical protein